MLIRHENHQIDGEKHVGFSIESENVEVLEDISDEHDRPSRLHRRDTPHHLKNKRISSTTKNADLEKVASIIAQVGWLVDWMITDSVS